MPRCDIHSQAYYDEECPKEGCIWWDKEEGICKWKKQILSFEMKSTIVKENFINK